MQVFKILAQVTNLGPQHSDYATSLSYSLYKTTGAEIQTQTLILA